MTDRAGNVEAVFATTRTGADVLAEPSGTARPAFVIVGRNGLVSFRSLDLI